MASRRLLIARRLCLLGTFAAAVAGLAVLAVLALTPPPVPPKQAWFCRIWQASDLASMTGPACALHPVTYRPPWPYLGPDGKVVDPSLSPQESP